MLRKGICAVILFSLLVVLLPVNTTNAAPNWNLVWSDEFNGTSLNRANWTPEIGTGSGGWGNNELQYYTDRAQNVQVTGGNLVITAQKESYGGMNYTSARIKTQDLKTFTYGKVEARIKLPSGQGLWPAFWMLGSNITSVGWPKSGEIDIMERVNNNPYVNGTVHWDAGGHAEYGRVSGNLDFSQFHVYSMEWDSKYIRWFVDGVQFNEFYIENGTGNTEEFQRPFFILLNLAVGGNWPGSPNNATPFPSQMLVDYVRVYQDNGASNVISDGIYTIAAKASGKVMDVVDVSTASGAKIQQWTNYVANNQRFRVESTGDGYYKLTAVHSGKVLDVPNSSTATGVQLQQWDDNGSNAQRWRIVDVGGGYYKIISKTNGLVVDVASASTADGAAIQQWSDNGSDAQKWAFTKIN
ncbi:1,3--beta-D-glucan 3-glucanohydrolase [Paenibacillus glucanolyticus]|uniref:1,3--beta-D-glucan 3-glucanohydrolase n=2 Tax=Paenibacillus glucanolyticus TaxID=59843 RepID=A0A163LWX6_9BACL|nr:MULTISPECIES: RICIN domain-containing protein [Paenibacillus]AWP27975.1 1,3--beta-D-glucan 3-glucanohydrolase [Paenibacillus sp. Cedars]KZS48542.1 1,3--beta-D-glucan 3-glucanohydrolase [Paenibacillus glucanolyticus]MPY17249.1 family 16 glycosylhydrolase [Paenibacillus glucanolyticus]OMF80140.1 1,3--beta-D-glucan 3-glucanohydrolase [Paenibacillus glucanolyticus]